VGGGGCVWLWVGGLLLGGTPNPPTPPPQKTPPHPHPPPPNPPPPPKHPPPTQPKTPKQKTTPCLLGGGGGFGFWGGLFGWVVCGCFFCFWGGGLFLLGGWVLGGFFWGGFFFYFGGVFVGVFFCVVVFCGYNSSSLKGKRYLRKSEGVPRTKPRGVPPHKQ